MGTGRKLRPGLTALGVALCVVALGGCQTPSLKTGEFPTGWEHFVDRTHGNDHVFVPPGATMERWTEKVELRVVYRPFLSVVFGASTPGKWLDGYQKHLQEQHAENAVSMVREAPDGILFDGVEKGEAGKPSLKFVGRLFDRRASRFILRYFVKAPGEMTPSRRTKWIDWLLKARIE